MTPVSQGEKAPGERSSRGPALWAHRRSGDPLRSCSAAELRSVWPDGIHGTLLTGRDQVGTVKAFQDQESAPDARSTVVSADFGDRVAVVCRAGRVGAGGRRSASLSVARCGNGGGLSRLPRAWPP